MKRTAIKPKSAKRIVQDREFAKVRLEVLFRDGHCAFIFDSTHGPCGGPLDPHHIVTRARDRKMALDPDNLITLCRNHHSWVHDNPAEATERGLLKSASRPSGTPEQT